MYLIYILNILVNIIFIHVKILTMFIKYTIVFISKITFKIIEIIAFISRMHRVEIFFFF